MGNDEDRGDRGGVFGNLRSAHTQSVRKARYSDKQAATMSGVKQSTLDNIVRGLTKNPRVATLHKIAIAFNMTLSEFLDFDELNDYSFDDDFSEAN